MVEVFVWLWATQLTVSGLILCVCVCVCLYSAVICFDEGGLKVKVKKVILDI